jgi:Reverse transcriptase (RNA-dependent DNA polymerase)
MRISSYLKENDFKQCSFKYVIYVKAKKNKLLIIILYVDDLIFMDNNKKLIDEFKKMMELKFERTYLRMMKYFFDLEIKHEK